MFKKIVPFLILFFALGMLVLYIFNSFSVEKDNAVDILASKKNMVNILLAGSNSFKDNKQTFFAVLSINPETGKTGMTFIPPKLEVNLYGDGTGYTLDQVNVSDYEDLCQALSKIFRRSIPFYVSFYSPDIINFVDYTEGIDLYLLDSDKNIYGSKQGINYFDGEKTIQYINNVPDNTIFQKYDRIQDLILTLYYSREKYAKFFNPFTVKVLTRSVKTNINQGEFLSLGNIVLGKGDLICTVLPGRFSSEGIYYVDEVAYKIYEASFLKKLLFKEKGEMNVKVRVLNATSISGLAKKTRNSLVREGINVVEFATFKYGKLDKSVLINQNGDISAVKYISELTGITNVYHITDSTVLNDVMVIIGKDNIK